MSTSDCASRMVLHMNGAFIISHVQIALCRVHFHVLDVIIWACTGLPSGPRPIQTLALLSRRSAAGRRLVTLSWQALPRPDSSDIQAQM